MFSHDYSTVAQGTQSHAYSTVRAGEKEREINYSREILAQQEEACYGSQSCKDSCPLRL